MHYIRHLLAVISKCLVDFISYTNVCIWQLKILANKLVF